MRDLVIKRIVDATENGMYLDEYDTCVDELKDFTDEELLDLFQEIVFGG